MSDLLQVEHLLKELQGDAALESTGAFTLDLKEAAPKLSQFQLSDPFQYVLKLVQAAVAGDATAMEVRTGTADVQVTLHGVGFSGTQLSNLLYYLLQDDQARVPPALRHLAIAVNSAVATRASEITLRSFDGQEATQVRWRRSDQVRSEWKPRKPVVQTSFSMKRVLSDSWKELAAKINQRDVLSMARGGREGMDNEQALIYDECSFCPVPITLNGQLLSGYELGVPPVSSGLFSSATRALAQVFRIHMAENPKRHLFELYRPAEEGRLGLAPPSLTHCQNRVGFAGDLSSGETFARILVLTADFSERRRVRVVPVQDGVLLRSGELIWDGPGGVFYLTADDFGKDLTSFRLVEGAVTDRRLHQVGVEFLDALEKFVGASTAGAGLDSSTRSRLLKKIEAGRRGQFEFRNRGGG